MDNRALLEAIARGDAAAWERLVTHHERLLWSVARGFRLPDAETEDVVQTTWLKLLENVDRIKDPERLAGWLATTTRNECLQRLRRARRERVDLEPDSAADLPAADPAVDHGLLLAERDAALWRAVDRLPEQCRQLLRVLSTSPGLSYAEVATLLDIPIGSIGPRRGRCFAQLHTLVRDDTLLGPDGTEDQS
ncbi:MAG TPA: sigma-70 family RNA polymerase sigma factor [Umezawaea sp.]|nr:sigma-70 family RNA polymerase sigma factor [Umezawaea sp.]